MVIFGKLFYFIRLRELVNIYEFGLDLFYVVSVFSVFMNDYGFSLRSFLLVVWIMISYILVYIRLVFYKIIINIFINDVESKGMFEFCYFNSRVLYVFVNLLRGK